MSNNKKTLSKIKSSLLERGLSVAKIGLNAGIKYAAHKVTSKENAEKFDEFLTHQAAYLTSELGDLKGSLMKAGQMLSMYGEHFFPPQANEFLKKLQTDSPPLDWPVMQTYLQQHLEQSLIDELEINPISIGTASMGQVHVATIKSTGEKIALKIQYPNLENAIDSDLRALKTLLRLSKLLPSDIDLDPILAEVKIMLKQELDYTIEAKFTQEYAEHIKKLNEKEIRYKVPQVFERYSNKRVLATEYMNGFKADHALIQSLSQNRRDQLATNFLELYFNELFNWNLMQTDPHLGNYKIDIDSNGNDRIILLDFGATTRFPDTFIQNYRQFVKSAILRDAVNFKNAALALGFLKNTDEPAYIEMFTNFCYEMVEPFKTTAPYDWKKTDLPQRLFKKALQFKNFDLRSPPKDILFLDRKSAGVFIFMSVLKTEINARKVVDPFLNTV